MRRVLLADSGVSRRHVKLLPSPLGLSVVDLGSRNGTLLNGMALVNRTNLEPGDVLRLGATELVVVMPAPARPVQQEKQTMLKPRPSMVVPAPPPMPAVPVAPRKLRTTLRWLFTGAESPPDMPRFRNYMEIPRRVPLWGWHGVRTGSILIYIALGVGLFVRPAGAQFAFFKVIVPIPPILFFVAPGLWRNIYPLAAANQARLSDLVAHVSQHLEQGREERLRIHDYTLDHHDGVAQTGDGTLTGLDANALGRCAHSTDSPPCQGFVAQRVSPAQDGIPDPRQRHPPTRRLADQPSRPRWNAVATAEARSRTPSLV